GEHVSQLHLGGVDDLVCSGWVTRALASYLANKVVGASEKCEGNSSFRSAVGRDADVGETPNRIQRLDALPKPLTVEGLTYFLRNQLAKALLIGIWKLAKVDALHDHALVRRDGAE